MIKCLGSLIPVLIDERMQEGSNDAIEYVSNVCSASRLGCGGCPLTTDLSGGALRDCVFVIAK